MNDKKDRRIIRGKSTDEERAFYGITDTDVRSCSFIGPADGESALKETRNIRVALCKFALRYPLWHSHGFTVTDCVFDDTCRAPIWYSSDGVIRSSGFEGVKILRECESISISDCRIHSEEFGWRCRNVSFAGTEITSSYFMFESENIRAVNLDFTGKYSFQYVKNCEIERSFLDTKDAFWHAENVTVSDCTVKGEYLGWYSKNLTFRNCTITGTQPFCYAKGLRLENCTMEGCDLAFEYSDVQADITGNVASIKNPMSGIIRVGSVGEIIRENPVYPCSCEIIVSKETGKSE